MTQIRKKKDKWNIVMFSSQFLDCFIAALIEHHGCYFLCYCCHGYQYKHQGIKWFCCL